MRITDGNQNPGRGLILLASLFLAGGVVGCGPAPATQSAEETRSEVRDGTKVTDQLHEILGRGNISVHDIEPSGSTPESELESAISPYYRLDRLGGATAYPVEVDSSDNAMIAKGARVWMVHIPDVPQEPSVPYMEGDELAQPGEVTVINTDMFIFVDDRSGEFLTATFIGP